MSIVLSITFEAKPGKEKALQELASGLLAPTHKEKGCIQYDLHRSIENPGLFMFYEVWATQADLDAHHQSAHLKAFREKLGEFLEKTRERTLWEKI